jgi:KUP system potassium uptake protein
MEEPPEKDNSKVKMLLEKYKTLHTALLIVVLLGTCMVIGDGVLTPAISGNNPISSLFLHNVLQVASFIPRST